MTAKRFFPWMLALSVTLLAHEAQAQTSYRAQLRRTVDPADRSAYGSVTLRKSGAVQTFQIDIRGLGEPSFGTFLGTNTPTYAVSNLVSTIAPLDRTNAKRGNWTRKLTAVGAAPAQIPFVTDLDQLAGTFITVSKPGADLLVGVTNVVNGVTNVLIGVPNFNSGGTGQVFSVLWAPLSTLSTSASTNSFRRKATLDIPAGPVRPSPTGKGTVSVKFTGSTGRSVLDVRARNLLRGQVYSVWIIDSGALVFVKAGDMVLSRTGSSARFIRDTQFADPLPQQVANVGDLSGRLIVILDDFEDIHLEGVIP